MALTRAPTSTKVTDVAKLLDVIKTIIIKIIKQMSGNFPVRNMAVAHLTVTLIIP